MNTSPQENPDSRKKKKLKGPIAWMASNPVAANLLMLILLGGGIWTSQNIQKEVFPQFALDIVEVRVQYPGAAPEEVEQGILLPVEETIRGVKGIKEITSTAREGSGNVQIELVAGTDRMRAFQDIDQAVSRIRTFPDDIEEPEVRLEARQRDVMELGLYGEVDIWTLRKLAERLRDQLLSHPGITQVEIGRVPDYVTHVEIENHTLREYGLTLGNVSRIIEQASQDIPAGAIDTHDGEILLRMKERKQWAEDLGKIPIVTADTGAQVLLEDIAKITDGFEEEGFHSEFNQQPSVEVEIFRVGKQSPLDVAAAVQSVLKDFESTVPKGVHIRIDSNRAKDYEDRLSLLLENGAMAVVIVLCILGLFLEYKLAFWVMMGMVISFIGGIMFMPMVGLSINMISMFAFLIALGIVVDDAIVIGENVYEYREKGFSLMDSAIKATRDIAVPVTFTILTTIVAFIPIFFIPGTMGKFWWPIPAVVIIVLLVSLVEALFILPAHLAHTSEKSGNRIGDALHSWQQKFSKGFRGWVDKLYRPFLEMCLKFRYITLTIAFTILVIVGAYAYSDHMGMIMMPEVAADEIEAGVRLPVGTTRDESARVARQITKSTMRMFEEHDLYAVAEGVKTNVRGGSFIDVEIVMKPPEERDMTAREVIALWRDEIGDIPGVRQISFEAERGPGGWRDDISVDLSHSNIDVLEKASQSFVLQAESFESTRDVSDNYNRGKKQYDFKLLDEGYSAGLTPAEVGRQLRNSFYGAVARRQLRGTNEIEIRVKYPDDERKGLNNLEGFIVRTDRGVEVPLEEVAKIKEGEAFTSINRRAGRRIVSVGMDVEPARETTRVIKVINEELLPNLRADFPGITWSFEGSNAEMRESTQTLWGGFGLAMFVVYALLAIVFSSYLQPIIVMTAIPFGIVGAVIGHILLGHDLSLMSLMGVIALSGVVVNDSLIMVDYANRNRDGKTAFEAIHQAGIRRFRPIILTTLTTFGGLTPIILERSQQANYLIPMAISLGFGIVFATAVILVIVPCLYMVLEDVVGLKSKPSSSSGRLSAEH